MGRKSGGAHQAPADSEWFARLWRSYASNVYAYAARRTNVSDAEDVVADTFVVAWRRREEHPDHELAWLYGIARRVVGSSYRSSFRRRRLSRRVSDVVAHREADAPVSPDRRLGLDVLAGLSESDRETLLLCAWEGLTPDEAAFALGISPSAYRMRLARARKRLRADLLRVGLEPVDEMEKWDERRT